MTSSSRSFFLNENNQQSHIINILLALFALSSQQVMDPRFFLPCFHSPRALRLGHKRKEKTRSIACRTDLAPANKKYITIITIIIVVFVTNIIIIITRLLF